MLKYKLTDMAMKTHRGFPWKLGKAVKIEPAGNTLCSEEVIHYYDHPALAVLFNPIHADFPSGYRLWEVDVENIVAHDGLKGGAKQCTLITEIPVPDISTEQKI